MLFLYSFLILLVAEMSGAFHSLCTMSNSKHGMAFFSALSSALWCAKIVVVIDQPLTIISATVGAYIGNWIAFWIDGKYIKIKNK